MNESQTDRAYTSCLYKVSHVYQVAILKSGSTLRSGYMKKLVLKSGGG